MLNSSHPTSTNTKYSPYLNDKLSSRGDISSEKILLFMSSQAAAALPVATDFSGSPPSILPSIWPSILKVLLMTSMSSVQDRMQSYSSGLLGVWGKARCPEYPGRRTLAFLDVFVQDVPGVDDGLDVVLELDLPVCGLVGMFPQLLGDISIEGWEDGVGSGYAVEEGVELGLGKGVLLVVAEAGEVCQNEVKVGHDRKRLQVKCTFIIHDYHPRIKSRVEGTRKQEQLKMVENRPRWMITARGLGSVMGRW